ncbi:MAG: glucose 1-dehydrogenase [Acidobacteriota bacterium]
MIGSGLQKRFQDQVALVVGGAQGIGKAIVVQLAREGASVVMADIDKSAMEKTQEALTKESLQVQSLLVDVRLKKQVDRMVERVVKRHGRIDILMYVAGVGKVVPFCQTTEADWDFTVDINLKGAFLVSRAVTPHMIGQRRGKLVFMASTNSWDGEAGLAPYNASKAGLYLLAKTLARELGPHGINSNAIGPGLIRTRLTEPVMKDKQFMKKYENLIPVGRIGEPEDVAGPAVFLASREADYVNGVMLFVDGGQLA